MSKLEKLIAEFCPNGVEFKKLGEICIRQKGTSITAGDMKRLNNAYGAIRIFAAGNTVADVNYGDIPQNDVITKTNIIVKSRGNIGFEYYTEPFSHKNEMWSYSTDNNNVNLKYVYYYLMNHIRDFQLKVKMGKLPQISTSDTDDFKIPVPALPVQNEIVRILDNFTELTARKKQYEYYRDELLNFDESTPFYPLNDVIFSLNTGLNPRQFFKLNTDDATNYYITIRELHGGRIKPNEKTDKINDEALRLCNNRSNLEAGDVLFSGTGTIGETAIIENAPTNWNIKEGVYTIKPNQQKISSKFLRYLLTSRNVKSAYLLKVAGGTVKSIPMAEMKKLKIHVPTLEEQRRIVAILDRFDALCTNISVGLPAEIEARKKQYKYYRDKLLSFKELSA